MYCKNCGRENNNIDKFCNNCGENLYENKELTLPKEKKNKLSHTTLSLLSLIFCAFKIAVIVLPDKLIYLSFLRNIPWILISLVLAIVSRCKYKDTMSLIMIIIDIVLIILLLIVMIIMTFFLLNLFKLITMGCN
ncbi:MAG: zinc ribbon domain-containing protein [Bacilli bacterium]|nr:zinc ribbon domain-containing protein [Bacilli bacterium]